ncbi:hypothetical protein ACX93W_05070 [Paenibacillus sp. CAU 1782]
MSLLANYINKRKWEVVELCEASNADLNENFYGIIKLMKHHSESEELDRFISEIEDMFAQKTNVAHIAYKHGLHDGLKLLQNMNDDMQGIIDTVSG